MTKDQLKEIRERCEEATPGPWRYEEGWVDRPYDHGSQPLASMSHYTEDGIGPVDQDCNGEFIAHARTDIPLLLAEIEQLQKLLKLAKCPCCDGSGGYPQQISDDECEEVQCQWCFETKAILGEET